MLRILAICLILLGSDFSLSDKIILENYYKSLSKAKVYISNKDFNNALREYKIAFKIKKNPFFVDIKNGISVAVFLKDTAVLRDFKNILIKKGVNFDNSKDSNLLSNEHITSVLNNKQKLRNKLLMELFIDDQSVRPLKAFLTDSEIKLRDSTDHVNFRKFINIINKYGFPNEELYGYHVGNYSLWEVINGLCIHFILIGYGNEIMEHLEKSFNEGHLPNGVYASLIDRRADAFLNGNSSVEHRYLIKIGAKDYYPLFNKTKINVDGINKRRMDLFLDSLHISQEYFLTRHYCKSRYLDGFTPETFCVIEYLPFEIFGDDKSNPDLIRIIKNKYECN